MFFKIFLVTLTGEQFKGFFIQAQRIGDRTPLGSFINVEEETE